jgi:uncharacterized protein
METLAANETHFVDSHVHLDLVAKTHRARITWLRKAGCLPVSWAMGGGAGSVAQLRKYLKAQRGTVHRLRKAGLAGWFLTGVHPRHIPAALKPEALGPLLAPFLADTLCRGVGEIGLETAGGREKEIFIAQLELLRTEMGRHLVVGVHTPRQDKERVTEETLAILNRYTPWADRIVVDHCSRATLGAVLERGFWAGVTLNPQKSSAADVIEMLADFPRALHRVMLNSDSGSAFHEDLQGFVASQCLPPESLVRLSRDNALTFYRLPRPQKPG